jgi:epoxyqueuosine reductase
MADNLISEKIKEKSKELGFSDCGIVKSGFLYEEEDHLLKRLREGNNGVMDYLNRDAEKRLDPAKLVKNAKTIVIVLQNYFTTLHQTDPEAPVLSKYSFGTDYHLVIKEKIQKLFQFIREEIPGCSGRIFVDSAPILEKALARRAGLGWIGKNSLLISPVHGSFVFIGEIILDTELSYDPIQEIRDHCRNCTLCLEACPTHALKGNRMVDVPLCIAYQTIENHEGPDIALRGSFRNRVFGCDICQDVCPWNQKAVPHEEPAFNPSPALLNLTASEWAGMDENLFQKLFYNSPVKRAGFEKLKKNIDFVNFAPGVIK